MLQANLRSLSLACAQFLSCKLRGQLAGPSPIGRRPLQALSVTTTTGFMNCHNIVVLPVHALCRMGLSWKYKTSQTTRRMESMLGNK